jgi:MFS family permease
MADMFRSEERGAAMALWSIGPLLGPVIGPIGGAYLGQAKGWRWDFWLLVMAVSLFFQAHGMLSKLILSVWRCHNCHVDTRPRDIRSSPPEAKNRTSGQRNRK